MGKTTSAVNIAYYLSKRDYRTLLIDFDPQGNATSGLGINKQDLGGTMSEVILETTTLADIIIPTKHKNLFIAPTTSYLANTEVELAQANRRFSRLKNAVDNTLGYDYVIIDNPPRLVRVS